MNERTKVSMMLCGAPRWVLACTMAALVVLVGLCGEDSLGAADGPVRFIRGDANVDGRVTLSDVFAVLRYLWLGSSLKCLEAADIDDDGGINQTDALLLLESIFYRHGPPPPPFQKPGEDPTSDLLGCREGLWIGGAGDPSPLAKGAGAQDPDDVSPGTDCGEDGGGPDLEFIHFLRPVLASPGEQNVRVPIVYRSGGGVEGFTLSVFAPPQSLRLERIEFGGTVLSSLDSAPQWMHVFKGKQNEGFLAASVALSIAAPFETLPILSDETLAFLDFSVLPGTPLGAKVEILFQDTPGEKGLPPIRNEVSRKGVAQPRHFCGVTVEVVSGEDVFVRGDANRDRLINLGDVVSILRHLFAAGTFPVSLPCPDAADVDDNGRIGITDAISLLNFLFLRGPHPAAPFPEAGRDSSPAGNLGCVQHE